MKLASAGSWEDGGERWLERAPSARRCRNSWAAAIPRYAGEDVVEEEVLWGGRLPRCQWNLVCEGEIMVCLLPGPSSQGDLAEGKQGTVGALVKGEAVVDDDPASAHRTQVHVGGGRRDGDGPVLGGAPEDENMDSAVDTERARYGEV